MQRLSTGEMWHDLGALTTTTLLKPSSHWSTQCPSQRDINSRTVSAKLFARLMLTVNHISGHLNCLYWHFIDLLSTSSNEKYMDIIQTLLACQVLALGILYFPSHHMEKSCTKFLTRRSVVYRQRQARVSEDNAVWMMTMSLSLEYVNSKSIKSQY